MGRDCFDLVDLGWCGLGWDDLRFLEGTGDDGVFEGDVCVVGGQVSPGVENIVIFAIRAAVSEIQLIFNFKW